MGADPTGEVSKLFDVYIEEEGLALRGTFIIDPDGVLNRRDPRFGHRSLRSRARKLEAACFVREHGDQVCPANWTPAAIRSTTDMVGKIY